MPCVHSHWLGDVEGGYEAIVHWNLPSNVKLIITEQYFQEKEDKQ